MDRPPSDEQVRRGEISTELEFHFAATVDALVARGWTESDARVEAERRFGNRERYEQDLERIARGRRAAMTDGIGKAVRAFDPGILARDLRYAVRMLKRTPGFTVPALLALTLGIGANTAVFSVVNGVLLRPLPYADPDRLVRIYDSYPQQGEELGAGGVADFLDWKARARSFAMLDAFGRNRFTLSGDGDAEQVVGMGVTGTFFETLGVRPLLGRAFAPGEDQPGRPRSVVLSERLWRRRYNSASDILGRQIVLNGRPAAVVGVMPASFVFGSQLVELWATLALAPPVRRGPFSTASPGSSPGSRSRRRRRKWTRSAIRAAAAPTTSTDSSTPRRSPGRPTAASVSSPAATSFAAVPIGPWTSQSCATSGSAAIGGCSSVWTSTTRSTPR